MSRTMRLCWALGAIACATSAFAQVAPPPPSAARSSRESVERDYKAAKDQADRRERDWDRRMRERMKSICTGC